MTNTHGNHFEEERVALALDLRGSSRGHWPVWKHPITVGNTRRVELLPHGSQEAEGEREVARIQTHA